MELHYRELGHGKPLVILHGLFGFSDNWQTHAKKLAEYYRVILVDLRNHGHSPWSDEFDYQFMVQDLKELFTTLNLSDVILIGHSMGGKVAMHFAQSNGDLLNKIVVEEMAIRSKLLEHVGNRIITRCFTEIPAVSRIKLEVSKLNPPIGGDVEAVTIEMEEFRN